LSAAKQIEARAKRAMAITRPMERAAFCIRKELLLCSL
jgi:hypothetical protein